MVMAWGQGFIGASFAQGREGFCRGVGVCVKPCGLAGSIAGLGWVKLDVARPP